MSYEEKDVYQFWYRSDSTPTGFDTFGWRFYKDSGEQGGDFILSGLEISSITAYENGRPVTGVARREVFVENDTSLIQSKSTHQSTTTMKAILKVCEFYIAKNNIKTLRKYLRNLKKDPQDDMWDTPEMAGMSGAFTWENTPEDDKFWIQQDKEYRAWLNPEIGDVVIPSPYPPVRAPFPREFEKFVASIGEPDRKDRIINDLSQYFYPLPHKEPMPAGPAPENLVWTNPITPETAREGKFLVSKDGKYKISWTNGEVLILLDQSGMYYGTYSIKDLGPSFTHVTN